MEYKRLSECAYYSDLRTNAITFDNYISTENMLPNKGGITIAESLPDTKSASKYEANDILISNIRPYFRKIWIADKEGSCSNDVLVIKSKEGFLPRFLYYVLSDNNFFNYDTVTSKGTKMPRGTPAAIMKYIVPNYYIDKQKAIIDVLFQYDSLIEANNKRIKILEQMAENLYREWFVRFRFPGYETAEFENGLPKGWALSTVCEPMIPNGWYYGEFGELGNFIRGKNITSDEMIEGEIPVISAGLEPSGYHNESNVHGRSLTVSASGANAGYMKYNLDDIWAADCSYYQSEKHFWFAYSTLKFLQSVISNLQCGAAQPHVHPNQINKLSVIIPPENLINKYCEIVEPMFCEIKSLLKQNNNLIKQRDLLVPHLISGKLEV